MAEVQPISDSLERRRREARAHLGLDQMDIDAGRNPFAAFAERNLRSEICRALVQDITECKWSREEIALGLSKLLGREVKIYQLDAMTAETKDHRFPAEWVPAWVRVTGSARLLELLCAESGMWLADDVEHDLADLGRNQVRAERAAAVVAMKKKLLESVEV